MTERFDSTTINFVSIGDLVTKVNGKKPIEVTEICDNYIYGHYVDSKKSLCDFYKWFKPYENNDQTIMSKEQLFTWTDNDTIHYGTYLATNSSGQYVIEEKQTGRIVTIHPDYLEEVVPWTFSAKNGSTEKHFTGSDTIKKGDVLYKSSDQKVWNVTAVDTKSKNATKFVGRRLVTEEI
jgi:hypothetical protein